MRPEHQGYLIAGLGASSGAHVGLKFNTTNYSSVYAAYGVVPLQKFFGITSSIVSFGYNHYRNPYGSGAGFANLGFGLVRINSASGDRSTNAILISPNIGYENLSAHIGWFLKLGLIGAVSNSTSPQGAINVEIGLIQRIW